MPNKYNMITWYIDHAEIDVTLMESARGWLLFKWFWKEVTNPFSARSMQLQILDEKFSAKLDDIVSSQHPYYCFGLIGSINWEATDFTQTY